MKFSIAVLIVFQHWTLGWAQYLLNVDSISYRSNWTERFPCAIEDRCKARFQYCLRLFGRTEFEDHCLLDGFRGPSDIPHEMANTVEFNVTESYTFSSSFSLATTGQIQFFLEAFVFVPSLGYLRTETFFLDVAVKLDGNYTEILNVSGVSREMSEPGIVTARFKANYCQPRNDSLGHYKCDPLSNNVICLPGFCNAESNCINGCNECEPNPCQNGGICTDLFDDYRCDCDTGFSGKNCGSNSLPNSATSTETGLASARSDFTIIIIGTTIGGGFAILGLLLTLGVVVMAICMRKLNSKVKQPPHVSRMEQSSGTLKSSDVVFRQEETSMNGLNSNRASYVSIHNDVAAEKGSFSATNDDEHTYEAIDDEIHNFQNISYSDSGCRFVGQYYT